MTVEANEKIRIDITDVAKFVSERGFFGGFQRFGERNYDLGNALAIVEAIGKSRIPHFTIDSENRFTYENFIKWCHGDLTMRAIDPMTGKEINGDLKRGIYIAGNTGTGKSWCFEIMQAYANVWGCSIKFQSDNEKRPLIFNLNRADDISNEFLKSGDISRFKNAKILGIQDLGQEQQEVMYMGNRLNVMQQIVEYRGDRSDQLTFISSNIRISSEKGMKERYGDRVQSRLAGMCNYFEIKGKDRRLGVL